MKRLDDSLLVQAHESCRLSAMGPGKNPVVYFCIRGALPSKAVFV
jgi:hypothetical protein